MKKNLILFLVIAALMALLTGCQNDKSATTALSPSKSIVASASSTVNTNDTLILANPAVNVAVPVLPEPNSSVVYAENVSITDRPFVAGEVQSVQDGHAPKSHDSLASIIPVDLLGAYRDGTWDGSLAYSSDLSTTVEVSDTGELHYHYTESAVGPWWSDSDSIVDYTTWYQKENGDIYRSRGSVNDDSGKPEYECAEVNFWVDMPDGCIYESDYGQVICARWTAEDGLWLLTTKGLYHFRQGELLESWQTDVDKDSGFSVSHGIYEYSDEFQYQYLYTGMQLLEVLPNGELGVLLDHTEAGVKNLDPVRVRVYYVDDGALMLFEDLGYNEGVARTTIFRDGVVNVVNDGEGLVFVDRDDGNCYYAYASGYGERLKHASGRLGSKSAQEYLEAWQQNCAAGRSFADFLQAAAT